MNNNLGFVRVDALKLGDIVDLQGDQYADPHSDHTLFEYEYVPVSFIERETDSCIVLGFEGFDRVGFPPEHKLRVVGNDPDFVEE